MKKVLYLIFISFLSCHHEEDCKERIVNIDLSLPVCVQELIKNDSTHLIRTIRAQKINKEVHYWINTDVRFVDGNEEIVDANCNTVCGICGFCDPNKCIECYCGEWAEIWKR